MATTYTGSYSTDTGVKFNLVAEYSYTQNITANTSTVTVNLHLSHHSLYASALSGSYLSVAGNKINYSKTISYGGGSGVVGTSLASQTVTVNHAKDGTGSCAIVATFVLNGSYSGKAINTLTLSRTLTLKTIPRASTVTAPSSINTGSKITGTISPASSSFTHSVGFIVDGTEKAKISLAANVTSYSQQIEHSWSADRPSKTMTVRLYTYSSGALIGSTDKTTTINVPESIIPTIESITLTPSAVLNGKYVQGKSSLSLQANRAKPGTGSSITNYYYSGKNIDGSNSSYTGGATESTKKSSVLQSAGKETYKVRVKDARGRYSEWKSIEVDVYPLTTPRVSSISVQRCDSEGNPSDNGKHARVTITTTHSSVAGNNTASVKLTNNKNDSTKQSSSLTTDENTFWLVYSGNFSLDTTYIITATITDAYGLSNDNTVILKSAERPVNIAKYGNGVAIGGMSTVTSADAKGKFECNWNTEINASLTVQGFRMPEIQHGSVSITPSAANTPTAKTITFAKEFSGTPTVIVSADTAVPGTAMLGVGTANRSATGCTIYLTRANTIATTVNWIAMY